MGLESSRFCRYCGGRKTYKELWWKDAVAAGRVSGELRQTGVLKRAVCMIENLTSRNPVNKASYILSESRWEVSVMCMGKAILSAMLGCAVFLYSSPCFCWLSLGSYQGHIKPSFSCTVRSGCCLFHAFLTYSLILQMEAVCSSKMSVNFWQTMASHTLRW